MSRSANHDTNVRMTSQGPREASTRRRRSGGRWRARWNVERSQRASGRRIGPWPLPGESTVKKTSTRVSATRPRPSSVLRISQVVSISDEYTKLFAGTQRMSHALPERKRAVSKRPSATPPLRVRVPRAMHEYALVPLLVILALCVLAAASIVGDQSQAAVFTAVRGYLKHFVGKSAASTTLGAVATGLVTVTSITFSVLLLAVQQTASTLSPVVFDQFIRRRTNQLYLGFFVGLALYSYLVMAAVQDGTPPIIGAFIATVLTVVALGCLLFLVYSTIDQMRPDNVIRGLHDRALLAHERETSLVRRTRRSPRSDLPVLAELHCAAYGYIEAVHLDAIARAVEDAGATADNGVEVELCVSVGQAVATGELVARVRHDDPDA